MRHLRTIAIALALLTSAALARADDRQQQARRATSRGAQPRHRSPAAESEAARRRASTSSSTRRSRSARRLRQAALILFDLVEQVGRSREGDRDVLPRRVAVPEGRPRRRAHVLHRDRRDRHARASTTSRRWSALVEIAIVAERRPAAKTRSPTLDEISPASALPPVPYVRGKYAFSQGKYDEALAAFDEVPKGSDFELQALYYSGADERREEGPRAGDRHLHRPRSTASRERRADRRVIELASARARPALLRARAAVEVDRLVPARRSPQRSVPRRALRGRVGLREEQAVRQGAARARAARAERSAVARRRRRCGSSRATSASARRR